MNKSFLLAQSNFRKNKGSTIAFIFLLILVTMMMYIGLILLTEYSKNFDRKAEETNAEDIAYVIQSRDEVMQQKLKDIIQSDNRIKDFEFTDILCGKTSYQFNIGELDNIGAVLPVSIEKKYGKFNFVERADYEGQNVIYLPTVMSAGGGFKLGDPFDLNLNGIKNNYVIAGFYENIMMSVHNAGLVSFIVSDAEFERLEAMNISNGIQISIKLHNRSDSEKVSNSIKKDFNPIIKDSISTQNYYTLVKSARTMFSQVISLIFIALSMIITIVAVLVTSFRISSNIENEMKSFGVLKGVGYSSGQIVSSILVQYLTIGMIGILIGGALTYLILPFLNHLMMIQSGIIWNYSFFPVQYLIFIAFLISVLLITCLFSSKKLKKIQPIVALRQGINTHNFKKNYFPLEKTKLNLNLSLAFKNIIQNIKQNCISVLLALSIGFVTVFLAVMFNAFCLNAIDKRGNAPSFLAGEQSDAVFHTTSENREDVYQVLKNHPNTDRVYYFTQIFATIEDYTIPVNIFDDGKNINNPDVCYRGRIPLYENEVMIGGILAEVLSKNIGDKIEMSYGDKTAEYIISGFMSTSNYVGKEVYILESGMSRVLDMPLPNASYFVLLKDWSNIDLFIEEINVTHDDKIVSAINYRDFIVSIMETFNYAVFAVVILMMIVSLSVIGLTLFLMIKAFLIRKKYDYGILKALGFKAAQLKKQMLLSFLPAILVGLILGVIFGLFFVNPMLGVLFKSLGIIEPSFERPPFLIIGFTLMMILTAYLTVYVAASKIKNLNPIHLINN